MVTDSDFSKGDEYHHPDGTVEIVFVVEEDRLLTVKEYPSAQFSEEVTDATYQGIDEDIAALPPVDLYRDEYASEAGSDSKL